MPLLSVVAWLGDICPPLTSSNKKLMVLPLTKFPRASRTTALMVLISPVGPIESGVASTIILSATVATNSICTLAVTSLLLLSTPVADTVAKPALSDEIKKLTSPSLSVVLVVGTTVPREVVSVTWPPVTLWLSDNQVSPNDADVFNAISSSGASEKLKLSGCTVTLNSL